MASVSESSTADATDASPQSVQLLEPDGLGLRALGGEERSSTVSSEPVSRRATLGATGAVVGMVLAIVIALVVFSRPGPPVSVDDTDQTTVPVSATPTTLVPGSSPELLVERTPPTQAIPSFDPNITPEVPGVISSFDAEGSLVVIDRTEFRPEEIRLEAILTSEAPASVLMIDGAPPIGFVQDLSFDGERIEVDVGGDRFVNPGFAPADLAPDLRGRVLVMTRGNQSTMVSLAPVRFQRADAQVLRWDIPGQPNILGHWSDRLVVERADRVWLVDEDLNHELVAEGRVLGYDGQHLVRLLCDDPLSCRIAVGPPNRADRRVVDLPAELALVADGNWTRSVSVSPDGERLAVAVRRGGLSLPQVIDMETGEAVDLADGMNHHSPLVWSPEGDWLAYLYTDDVMVWSFERNRSWRIPVNRELQTLLWRDVPPSAG